MRKHAAIHDRENTELAGEEEEASTPIFTIKIMVLITNKGGVDKGGKSITSLLYDIYYYKLLYIYIILYSIYYEYYYY